MGTGKAVVVFAALWASHIIAHAQQVSTNGPAPGTNAPVVGEVAKSNIGLRESTAMVLQLRQSTDTNSLDYLLSKHTKVHVSGPLIRPLKARNASDFSHRVLNLFNPFVDAQPNLPPGTEVSGPVNARAWSTIAGWSPGKSAFPDDSSHEPPQLRLITVRTERLPKEP